MNRFNQLIEPTPYVSQYVPLPLDLMMKAGAMKQGAYDTVKADIDNTQDLIKINSDPKHKEHANLLREQYNNQINGLADELVKTGNAGEIESKVRNLKRQFANDTNRIQLENNYLNYKQYQKDAEKHLGEDKYYEAYDPYNKLNVTKDKVTPFNYNGMLTKEDYLDQANKLVEGIAKSGFKNDGYKIDKSTGLPDIGSYGEYWKSGYGVKGVSQSKTLQVAADNAENLIHSPKGGRFLVDEYLNSIKPGIGHVEYDSLPSELKDIVKKHATDVLASLASKQIGVETESSENLNFLRKDLMNGNKPVKPGAGFSTETGETNTNGNWAKIAGLDNLFEDSGEIKADSPYNLNVVTYINPKGEKKTITYPTGNEATKGTLEEEKSGFRVLERTADKATVDKKIEQAQHELYSRASNLGLNVLKSDGSVDGGATKERLINYYKGLSTFSNYSVAIQNPNIVKNLSNDLFGKTSNISNMEIYESGNPESSSKYEGITDKAQFKNSKVIGLDYTSPKAGAIKFVSPTSTDKEKYGDTPFIGISRNKKLQDEMRPVQELTYKSIEASKTGKTDKAALTLTNLLRNDIIKDVYGHSIKLEQLGIPVASSKDNDGTLYISYLDTSMGTPMIQVLKKSPNKPTEIRSLDEIQELKTGDIFNSGGSLSEYQKQTTKEELPSQNYEE